MKYILSFAASVLVATTLLSVMPVYGEAQIYNDVLRLHVIAESDSEEDQAMKLKVRDAVLLCVNEKMSECETFDDAYAAVLEMKEELVIAAEKCIRDNGGDSAVTLELGQEKYPRREYGDATLPAGVYNSLRIIIGEGEGKNWWCILFPSLCTPFAKEVQNGSEYVAVGFTPEEYRMITGQSGEVKIRFKILEMLSDLVEFVKR